MGNITTSGAIVRAAGANVSTAIPEAAFNEWASGAESFVNAATQKNWSDAYATLNNDMKFIIHDTVTAKAAMNAIIYDMSGYTSRSEAQTMLDVLFDKVNAGIKVLEEKENKDWVDGTRTS